MPSDFSPDDVISFISQISFFNTHFDILVVNISDWKLSDKKVQSAISLIVKCEKNVYFILESSSIKSKFLNSLEVEALKVNNITNKNKTDFVLYLLAKNKISLDKTTLDILVNLLPNDIFFIKNEISKLSLLNKTSFDPQELKEVVFDTGETTIFKVIDAWLSNNKQKTIHELNNLLSTNFDIIEVIPMFAYKLFQLKMFLLAKKFKWPSNKIAEILNIPFWVQTSYSNLKPYDEKLKKINDIISKFYNFDINIKKQNINKKDSVPYAQLVKILLD